jgi:hypothetical protein
MRPKLDRYKRNREYRKNPTRSRAFFPYILPFTPDFSSRRRYIDPPIDAGYEADDDYADYNDDRVRRDEAVERMASLAQYRAWRLAQVRAQLDTQDLAMGVLQALTPNRPMALPYYLH